VFSLITLAFESVSLLGISARQRTLTTLCLKKFSLKTLHFQSRLLRFLKMLI